MLSTIQIYSLIGSIIYLLLILWNVRARRIKEAYALLWIFAGLAMVVVSVWTDCLRLISNLIGIQYPPATLFLLMLAGMVLVLFQYSVVLSRNQEKISRLTQEIALLKEETRQLREKCSGDEDGK